MYNRKWKRKKKEYTLGKLQNTVERIEGFFSRIDKRKFATDNVEKIKTVAVEFANKTIEYMKNIDVNNLLDMAKKLFDTKPQKSIGVGLAIVLALFFGLSKLTKDPLNGTYELLNRNHRVIMVIKGTGGSFSYENSYGEKGELGKLKIDRKNKELTITDSKESSFNKTKYMLNNDELYLQGPDETFKRVK